MNPIRIGAKETLTSLTYYGIGKKNLYITGTFALVIKLANLSIDCICMDVVQFVGGGGL